MTTLDELYRDLHAHPELAFEERRTAGIAAQRLRTAGFEVHEGLGGTGVAGVLRNGEGPTVLLRADMDALPVTEETGLDYASTVPEVMHACGHDVHVTCLVGAAERLATERESWHGTLVVVFQPAEETGAGAQSMVDDGLYERVPRPDVVLGQHVGPVPAGVIGLQGGASFATYDSLDITVHGRGGHGSRPETTVDPIVIAAAIVGRLQTIVSREVAPQETAVLTVGVLHAGTKHNIIPDEARLGVSIRTYSAAVQTQVLAAIERIARAEAAAAGAPEPTIEALERAPLTVNDPEATERVLATFRQTYGESAVIAPGQISGSEDVSILATAAQAPLVFWILGGADAASYAAAAQAGRLDQDVPSNHSPHFAPVIEPTLSRGVDALVVAARSWLD